jgi:hypothetical protein
VADWNIKIESIAYIWREWSDPERGLRRREAGSGWGVSRNQEKGQRIESKRKETYPSRLSRSGEHFQGIGSSKRCGENQKGGREGSDRENGKKSLRMGSASRDSG